MIKLRPKVFLTMHERTPGKCGAGGILYSKVNNYVSFKYAAGQGTNKRAEFFSLWLLLKCAADKGTERLRVTGN